jgi:DNA (cytosine-5)-methyltransferase 1
VKLLDLFCGAGGAAKGYHNAGFSEIHGVDIKPQPLYPYKFFESEAISYLQQYGEHYGAIHASPPCQRYTKAGKQWRKEGRDYPDMIVRLREALKSLGKPYVIENVPGSPLINPVIINGAMFGLRVHRVRWFECSFDIQFFLLPSQQPPVKMGRPVNPGQVIQPVGHFSNVPYARKEMGIDWMGQKDLAQAIPPVYTEFIGRQLIRHIKPDEQMERDETDTTEYEKWRGI